MILPRLTALSEVVRTAPENRSWDSAFGLFLRTSFEMYLLFYTFAIVKTWGRTIRTRFISVLLLALFSLNIGNKVIYLHTHINNLGKIVSHSHPYNKSSDNQPVKSHHHSNAAFAFLSQAEISVMISHSQNVEPADNGHDFLRPILLNVYTPAVTFGLSARAPPVI